MKIYNSLTRQKEEVKTIEEGKYKIYACGPTVYDFIHIGNARPICVFDTLRRYLEYRGNEVIYVQNFTDIDDKLIRRSLEEGGTVKEIAEKYIEEYNTDAKGLNIRPATMHPKATENIDTIIDIIKTLEEKGFAYAKGGDVYFKAAAFKQYGKLSHMPLEDLESGARIDVNDQKENPVDFALWKKAKPGEPAWASPWGEGRPGWHIECSAMVRRYLGDTIDIHGGGQDLVFPHHENEIAQSECATGHPLANYWMHNGYINIDNRKMSKSLGNFFTVREVAQKYGYECIRFMLLSVHYRSPFNYSADVLAQSQAALKRLYNCWESLEFSLSAARREQSDTFSQEKEKLDSRREQFINAMEDDFNTADGIAAIFELVKDINTAIADNTFTAKDILKYALDLFNELTGVLGILYNHPKKEMLDEEIEQLIAQRQQAKKEKNFQRADEIRDTLKEKGILLEDTREGVKWKKI